MFGHSILACPIVNPQYTEEKIIRTNAMTGWNRQNATDVGNVEVQPIRVRHMTLPILGYRIRNFAYITDGSFISTTELKKLQGVDVLVINALRKEEHYSHFNLEQALAIIRTVAPRRAYLTHISHHLGLYKELTPTLPDNVSLGIDNEVIEVASL